MTENEIYTFGRPVNPCEDCIDGECTMNCSTPMLPKPEDHGSLFLTREKDGKTITVRVRSPHSKAESTISLPAKIFRKMVTGIKSASQVTGHSWPTLSK